MALRVLHLIGSAASELLCELSVLYGRGCLEAIDDPVRYETLVAYVTPDGRWSFPTDLSDAAIASAPPMPFADAVQHLQGLAIDIMVPQMFCVPGMTHYRALFDLFGVPYIGNTPDVMALASHKARTRAVVARAGVDVPAGEIVRRGGQPSITPPAVVKPVDADNSVGVRLVHDRAQYSSALEDAFAHSDDALVETYIELGREVRCGIVVDGGRLVCLPLEEYRMDSAHRPIRSYADKLRHDHNGDLAFVAKEGALTWIVDPGDPVTARVWELATRCHVALGCRHYSLFDFRIDPSGKPWFIEAGLYCSFAAQSVISLMAKAMGIPTDELFQLAVSNALQGAEVKQ
jgi:D-alanine-D-alanine ligase